MKDKIEKLIQEYEIDLALYNTDLEKGHYQGVMEVLNKLKAILKNESQNSDGKERTTYSKEKIVLALAKFFFNRNEITFLDFSSSLEFIPFEIDNEMTFIVNRDLRVFRVGEQNVDGSKLTWMAQWIQQGLEKNIQP